MFKVAHIADRPGLQEAEGILKRIYNENPSHWPNGLTPQHFDGGLYLIRDTWSNNKAAGFCGWQERLEVCTGAGKRAGASKCPDLDGICRLFGVKMEKVGYYSIGILPEYRNNGMAKAALSQLIAAKSAGVDRVKAMIMASNQPSINLADKLGVEKVIKEAAARLQHLQ